MNIGSIDHKRGGLCVGVGKGEASKLISQVDSYFMLIHRSFAPSHRTEKTKEIFLSTFFMLVSDSETIETLLFMYLR